MKRRWRWLGWVLVILGSLAVAGISISGYLFSRWSEVLPADSAGAEAAFRDARERAGGGPAYVEILPTGQVRVRRELEGTERRPFASLHLLAWDPEAARLVRIAFPFWFVRMKMNDAVNLGTITTALAGDWRHLDLRVSVRDLERRGPGIVLDHEMDDGSRVLLWTSPPGA
ncbi:MAG: hypothetical protein PVF68_03720 [Acidobacteriota bacterium]|jgi:hypothetical protein